MEAEEEITEDAELAFFPVELVSIGWWRMFNESEIYMLHTRHADVKRLENLSQQT